MNTKISTILTHNLKPGMILAEDLTYNGVKLINKNSSLTENNIKKILELYPYSLVSVQNSKDIQGEEEENKSYEEICKNVEKNLSQLETQTEDMFKQVNHNLKPDINKLRNISEKIITQMKDYGVIIKNIIDYSKIDEVLYRHSVNVTLLSTMIGKWLNLNSRDLTLLTYSAILHDIGKTKLPKEIAHKISGFTPEEEVLFKTHSVRGYKLLEDVTYIDSSVKYGVLMHHERLDGSGYPFKLKENKIHDFSKIIAVADTFDTLTHDGKNRCSLYVLEDIWNLSFSKLDPKYCSIFLNYIMDYYTGETVLLNNGSSGKILKMDSNNITKPLLLVDSEFLDLSKEKDLYIEKFI
ncbi:HD-GYP domain-containing protein [Haloimpatiens sp. FM7315]|uniref:HD-GYP domain-containing protein n=1 Tax=Haloimpatiens sp. FM7315 TaxID=3298609 RepID=UPI0035A357A3